MIKREEAIQIYERWLAGTDIKTLAREFHHWRYVIEGVIRKAAQGYTPQSVQLILSLFQETVDSPCDQEAGVCQTLRGRRHGRSHGMVRGLPRQ